MAFAPWLRALRTSLERRSALQAQPPAKGVSPVSRPTAHSSPARTRLQIGRRPWRCRPVLESLEDRCLPSLGLVPSRILEFPLPIDDAQPDSITATANGQVWFTQPGTGQIGRLITSQPRLSQSIAD